MSEPYMKKGWTFEVKSWENDGDNYRDERKTVSDRDEANALADLIQLFEDDDIISNKYDLDKEEIKAMYVVFNQWAFRHQDWVEKYSKKTLTKLDSTGIWDLAIEYAYDVGLAGGGDFTTRVCEQWSVYYNEVDVHLNDVTNEFKKV